MAALAGRLVASRGWERLGFARARDYAVERLGWSARQLQDLARVDRALRALPGVEKAFLDGSLSWTKARLLARVATPADESAWLEVARSLTARALEQEVRAVDLRAVENGGALSDEDGAEEERRVVVVLRCAPAIRAKWSYARQLARRAAGENLPPWACAELIAAEVLSAVPLKEDKPESPDARSSEPPTAAHTPGPAGSEAFERARSAATTGRLPTRQTQRVSRHSVLRGLLSGLDHLDPFELDRRLRRAARLEQRLHARMGPFLAAIARDRLDRRGGAVSLDVLARERLGMSPRKARMLVRLERACRLCPELRDAYRRGKVTWVQAHALVPLVIRDCTSRLRRGWVAHAQRVTMRRLEEDVDRALAAERCEPPDVEGDASGVQTRARASAPATELYSPDGLRGLTFTAPADVARLFQAVLASVQRHLERQPGRGRRSASESEALDAMLEHVLDAWGAWAPTPREHSIFARDGWRCVVPGCTSYRNLHRHHVRFRSAGGGDEDANCVTLCAFHHLRGVHAGHVSCRGRAPDALRFELGVRQGWPSLAGYRSGDVLAA